MLAARRKELLPWAPNPFNRMKFWKQRLFLGCVLEQNNGCLSLCKHFCEYKITYLHNIGIPCDYFDAECCQRSLKRFEKVLHKKNKSKSSKLYSMFAILQCHALKVLWWSHSLKIFMPPLLLESWFKTEAGGGICSDVVRVSPIWHYLGTILSKVGIEHRQLVNYAGTTNSMQNNSVQKQTRNILQIRMFLQIFLITLRGQRLKLP